MINELNIVLFDGVCNLCNSTVSLLIKYDPEYKLHFAAQQTTAGIAIMNHHGIQQQHNSVVFIQGDKVFYKSDAIIEIAKLISGWPRLYRFSAIFPKFFRDGIYDLVAKNRYRVFGKRKECAIPTDANKKRFL
jgi:predicted DCC family thiol-disulfide oxidoreductase YuxK